MASPLTRRLRAILLGVLIGLLVGGGIGLLRMQYMRRMLFPAPLPEDSGRITRVVMQYHPDAGPLVAPIYTKFLTSVGKDVEVIWAVARQADADELKSRLGTAWPTGHCRIVVTGKEITTWSKDRFVAMRAPGRTGAAVLCAPARTRSPNPLRTNDQEVPYRLAQDPSHLFNVVGTDADFDGGDFLATARHLFAGPAIIEKNAPGPDMRFTSVTRLQAHLEERLGKRLTWLGETPAKSPPHHLGMFLTVIGRTAAVGDLRPAEKLAAAHPDIRHGLDAAGGEATPAFRADLQQRLDGVARQMQSLGYAVVRVPLLPSATPRAWMSYNNGIVDARAGKAIFYMPTFGAPTLDAAAAASFRAQLHCAVVPIDCAKVWHLGGSLHCLVNVVGRK